ncbi:siderophore-interacting protein [Microbulbifer sp. OS29]|uniref:Siderophore-interacting protein n=1 Tax=Microbulbifer okhotskensis TaxID=2926617 RepID=A0A9X2EQ43_9GAMM|nr:siderophore-interacting protein [Microbulbifer okhotskensis]MCO1335285.1 siderophore-interacting protein [Microbulbifer okhotskensis]
MAEKVTRELVVIRKTPITENMLRITLGGDDLKTLAPDQESAYIKFLFPPDKSERPTLRSYTIRHQRETEIDIDFALHEHEGPALNWALNTHAGDTIQTRGPGPKKMTNPEADWFLLLGDMTALPAISVNLAQLPKNAKGYALIEVASKADAQELEHPESLQIHWIVNPVPSGEQLLEKLQILPWLEGQPSVWAACEFESMRTLRKFFKQDKSIPKTHIYISSYWKLGQSDEGHKLAKRLDNEQMEGQG